MGNTNQETLRITSLIPNNRTYHFRRYGKHWQFYPRPVGKILGSISVTIKTFNVTVKNRDRCTNVPITLGNTSFTIDFFRSSHKRSWFGPSHPIVKNIRCISHGLCKFNHAISIVRQHQKPKRYQENGIQEISSIQLRRLHATNSVLAIFLFSIIHVYWFF